MLVCFADLLDELGFKTLCRIELDDRCRLGLCPKMVGMGEDVSSVMLRVAGEKSKATDGDQMHCIDSEMAENSLHLSSSGIGIINWGLVGDRS